MKTKLAIAIIIVSLFPFACAKKAFINPYENISLVEKVDELTDEVVYKINILNTDEQMTMSVSKDYTSYKIDMEFSRSLTCDTFDAEYINILGYRQMVVSIRFDNKEPITATLHVNNNLRDASFLHGNFINEVVGEMKDSKVMIVMIPINKKQQKIFRFNLNVNEHGFESFCEEVDKRQEKTITKLSSKYPK